MQPGKRRQLDLTSKWAQLLEQAEQLKASVRAKVEHPFHVIKNRFGHRKVRYKGLAKNEAQLFSLFGLANLVIAKRQLLPLHDYRNTGRSLTGSSNDDRAWRNDQCARQSFEFGCQVSLPLRIQSGHPGFKDEVLAFKPASS